jgi:pimeloyl-ACP methyl ester carboxylesterase
MSTERFVLSSGRQLAVHRLGGGERTIVFCHAAPGSGDFDPDPVETDRRAVTILAVDRPGYGGSEPVDEDAWSTVPGAADDLAEVMRGLEIGRVGVAGWSAGGRVALALAARHPDLVDRVCVLATPAPNDAVPWVPPERAAGLESLRGRPAAEVHAALGAQIEALVPADPRSPDALAILGASPADELTALARDGARERLGGMLVSAFTQGAVGMADDIAGYTLQPWGFEPADVRSKTLLLYGAKDPLGGSRHGRWWQRQLPGARLEMSPDAGHLLVIPMWKRVLSFLARGNP